MAKIAKRKTASKAKMKAKRGSARKMKATAKRTAAPKKTAIKSTSPIKSAYTKSQLLGEIAEQAGLKKKEVSEVFESLQNLIHRHLKNGGAGEFNMPGLLKCRVIHKPATKARRGINPFTGEETTFKAKPARNVVKVRPLKALKEMAR